MSASSSIIREKSLAVFIKLDKLGVKYIQYAPIRAFVERILRPRIENLIKFKIPEAELKTAMTEAFYEIKPIVEDFQLAHQLNEAKKLNTPELTKQLQKLPDFKKFEDLIDNVL